MTGSPADRVRGRRRPPGYAPGIALRLVLAEDSFLMREGISALLELDDELELIASCGSSDELLEIVDEQRPDPRSSTNGSRAPSAPASSSAQSPADWSNPM
jgi:hypothetical protein